eukprot:9787961-Karenia_brevis.AAC.1
MAYSNDILLLQEVHGTQHDVLAAFGWLSRDFRMWFFEGVSRGVGGLLLVVRRSLLEGAAVSHNVLSPGRVVRTIFEFDDSALVLWNVHNEDVS